MAEMRLLREGHYPVGQGATGRNPRPHSTADPRCARRKPVPVHRLHQDDRGDPGGRAQSPKGTPSPFTGEGWDGGGKITKPGERTETWTTRRQESPRKRSRWKHGGRLTKRCACPQ